MNTDIDGYTLSIVTTKESAPMVSQPFNLCFRYNRLIKFYSIAAYIQNHANQCVLQASKTNPRT